MLVLPVKITLINKPVKIMLILRIKRRNFRYNETRSETKNITASKGKISKG